MPVNIEMPKLSDTMTEGTVLRWHKQPGDMIEIGDIIAEIETDKATMEMEAFDEGVLSEIRVQAGEKAAIGSVLAVLDGQATNAPASSPAPAPAAQSPMPAAPATSAAPTAAAATQATTQAAAAQPAAATSSNDERVFVSPLARKIAAERGIDLSTVTGTGPAGRIIKSDIEKAASATPPASPAKPGPANMPPSSPASPSAEALAAAALVEAVKTRATATASPSSLPAVQVIEPIAKPDDQIIELSTMRKIIASRLLTSKVTIPHFYLHLEVDAAPLLALRQQVNEQAEKTHGNKYSVNDFILKAVINSAQAIPAVNASFAGDRIIQYKHVGLSIAVAVDDGLVTPVLKEAETKSLLEISRAVKDFAARAKEKKLKPAEFDGGTITVSSLGAWGIESFDAIVNPPQAAILSVGAVLEKPVVKNGQVVPGMRMNLGLSCDHRVVDGAVAASFLNEVRKQLEKPVLMLM